METFCKAARPMPFTKQLGGRRCRPTRLLSGSQSETVTPKPLEGREPWLTPKNTLILIETPGSRPDRQMRPDLSGPVTSRGIKGKKLGFGEDFTTGL